MDTYKETVGFFAMIITMMQMLAGTLICKDIYKKGTTEGTDSMPFIGATAVCTLMLRYALMLNDSAMINVNIFGLITSIIYMLVFYYYAPDTEKLFKQMIKVAGFVVIFLAYAEVESSEKIEYRFGMLVTILLLLLIASPLVHLREVIETKNADILPIPIIVSGTLVSFMWLWYGYIIDNTFLVFQNVIGLSLNVVQLSLFAMYGSKKSQDGLSSKQD
ncbi:hypothetical protein DMN91_004400 [Ooceraea biroi]|uniref:Sugar transporter SWEET1 n=1 Tax=Ooceraea biroi TaxID=2015173 RepID=A0A026W6P3_OOCBI|nr:sugar transporter SWEET1 [Ooceraea biroi]EZA51782.1 Sugar transporter SWEET1 [Ooceraea biroi]RLU24190.1 hypothetical protein DMN91_004400 [Ooceraea biroi]